MAHRERHRSERIGWLRAAVLGANDGIVSTASLVVGVAAADATRQDVLVAAIAGLVAGALSMAAGEYVSVSSQADTEQADLRRERHELATDPQAEEDELTGIYVKRGLEPELARTVARQLAAQGALAAHARDELGLTEALAARPLQAALASAATFAVGAGVPILTILLAPTTTFVPLVSAVSLLCRCCSARSPLESAARPCSSARRESPCGECWQCSRRPGSAGCSAPQSDEHRSRVGEDAVSG
jgi:vacuolar iron transporter family protein